MRQDGGAGQASDSSPSCGVEYDGWHDLAAKVVSYLSIYFVALYTSHAFTYVPREFLEYIYFSMCFSLVTPFSLCILCIYGIP